MRANNINNIVIIGFLVVLLIPSIIYFSKKENKIASLKPINILKNVKSDFPINYGLKNNFLNTYLYTKRNILKDETLKNRVIKGKNNWWFLGNYYNNTLNNVFGNTKYTANEINLIKNTLTQWNTYFKENNIAFYIIIPPNKNKIYKEELPFQLNENPTKISVLSKELQKDSSLKFIDLTSTILSEKTKKELYIKTDTHWNNIGAYYGYKKMIEELTLDNPSVKAERLSDYKIEYDSNYGGDIPRMVKEADYSLNIKTSKIAKNAINVINKEKLKQYENKNKELSVLIYHDSFMLAMMPYMNETFNTTTYLKTHNISIKGIKKHKPNIVILEIVERNLDLLLKLKKPLN